MICRSVIELILPLNGFSVHDKRLHPRELIVVYDYIW